MNWFEANNRDVVQAVPPSKRLIHFYSFIKRRQERYLARVAHDAERYASLVDDPVLDNWKFTNVYRILDRVTQYELKHVIDDVDGRFDGMLDHMIGIYVFRMFNSIPTWEMLPEEYKYCPSKHLTDIEAFVEDKRRQGVTIYNNAYMLTPPWTFGCETRTQLFMRTLRNMLADESLHKVYSSPDLRETFGIFLRQEGFGEFLAYQFALDYSYNHFDVEYEAFVVPGIGCQRGMRRVWPGLGKELMPGILKCMAKSKLWIELLTYEGKELPLRGNDLQNCFCEYDKYCRVQSQEKARLKNAFSRKYSQLEEPYIPKAWRI